MDSNENISTLLECFSIEAREVLTSRVRQNDYRLDAPAFLDDSLREMFSKNDLKNKPLAELANVFTVYIQSPLLAYVPPSSHSRPYLTTSEIGEYYQPRQATHVSLLADPRLIEWEIKKDYILVSRSGRVGDVFWVDERLDGALVGDCFRVVAKDFNDREFLYAFLRSPLAEKFICSSTYGSVVEHASVAQLRSLPVPILPKDTVLRITEAIKSSMGARSTAYNLLDEANSLVHKVNNLPYISSDDADWYDPERRVESFIVTSQKVTYLNEEGAEFRLDAHYYNPLARLAVNNIKSRCSDFRTLSSVTDRIIIGPRFKRNYVESDYGTPFLSGKSIVQINPELKYLSNAFTEGLNELLIKKGWTLITRSGTLGRLCFVWNNFENYAASEHTLRVVPKTEIIDPGYLYAFLSSQYGYEQILKYRHGSVIDEVTDKQLSRVLVPYPNAADQKKIGDRVREAYDYRAEAIRLEDSAQTMLMETQRPC